MKILRLGGPFDLAVDPESDLVIDLFLSVRVRVGYGVAEVRDHSRRLAEQQRALRQFLVLILPMVAVVQPAANDRSPARDRRENRHLLACNLGERPILDEGGDPRPIALVRDVPDIGFARGRPESA